MTPEQEQEVRRALASVPPAGPMPPEVADRLDARLAQLQSERTAGPDSGGEDSGATSAGTGDAASRGRRWPRMLVAAAVLTVVGIGLGNVMEDFTGAGGMDSATTESAGDAAEVPPAPREAAPEQAPSEEQGFSAAKGRPSERLVRTAERVRLRSGTLSEDVQDFVELRLLRARAAADEDVQSTRGEKPAPSPGLDRLFSPCVLPLTDPGDQLVAARLDGEPATLLLREPADGTRVAQVYSCDDPSEVLGRVRFDAR